MRISDWSSDVCSSDLFKRLVAIVETFKVPDIKELSAVSLRITPSRYLYAPLSKRCIPYYYDPVQMYPVWSWEKTRRGKSRNNLSHNAASYSASDRVVEPLNHDIEPFDFFRVEGQIGKQIGRAHV